VTSKTAADLVKVHLRLTAHSPIKVRMFEELEAAARWLDVSRKLLEFDRTPNSGRTG
jgi:hypothetical protein